MKKILTLLAINLLFINAMDAHPPIGIVMDSKGNVFYTDLTHVWKITPGGDRTIAVRNVHTHELFIDAQDNLFGEHEWYEGEATDKWGNYVWRLNKNGTLEKVIPDVEGFLDNTTLVRDPEGNSYWADRSGENLLLKKQTSGGSSTLLSTHRFKDIRWMYFSKHDNNLYIVDELKIKKVTPSGNVIILTGDLKEDKPPFEGVADRHYIFGIWTDEYKDMYVAVYGASKIKKIGPDGQITTVFESPDKNWSTCGGLIAPDQTLWVLEFSQKNTTRVRRVNPEGEDAVFGD